MGIINPCTLLRRASTSEGPPDPLYLVLELKTRHPHQLNVQGMCQGLAAATAILQASIIHQAPSATTHWSKSFGVKSRQVIKKKSMAGIRVMWLFFSLILIVVSWIFCPSKWLETELLLDRTMLGTFITHSYLFVCLLLYYKKPLHGNLSFKQNCPAK